MAFTPIPDAWRVAFQGESTAAGCEFACTFGVKDGSAHDNARAAVIAAAAAGWWNTSAKPLIATTWRLTSIYVLDQASSTGPALTYTTGMPIAGTRAGDPVTTPTAMRVKLGTGLRGRANRGRMFFPGGVATDTNAVDASLWDATFLASWVTAAAALPTAIAAVAGGPSMAVLSRSQGLAIPVTVTQPAGEYGIQKRRRAG